MPGGGGWPRVEVPVPGEKWLPRLDLKLGWRIGVTDTTLRDGVQGWRPLGVRDALRVYEALVELSPGGVIESTELFLYSEEQRRIARAIAGVGAERPRPIGWIRARRSDAALVLEAGLDETVVLASVGTLHVTRKLGVPWSRAVEKYLDVVDLLASHGVSVRLALEDVTRSEFRERVVPFVVEAFRRAERHGVGFRVKLSDTLGLGVPFREAGLPRSVPLLVEELRWAGLEPVMIEFHGHNDLGLVVANQLAAWLSGASWANCTLLGVGERAGNCPLEVMLLHYASITGRIDDVRLDILPRIVDLFRELGWRPHPQQPLVGDNVFSTKAGIHVDGILKDPRIYLPFNPAIVGRGASIEVNPLGGRSAIVAWLRSMGISVGKSDPRVERLYRVLAEEQYSSSPDEAIAALAREAAKLFPEARLGVNRA